MNFTMDFSDKTLNVFASNLNRLGSLGNFLKLYIEWSP